MMRRPAFDPGTPDPGSGASWDREHPAHFVLRRTSGPRLRARAHLALPYPTRRSRNQTPVANLGARASPPAPRKPLETSHLLASVFSYPTSVPHPDHAIRCASMPPCAARTLPLVGEGCGAARTQTRLLDPPPRRRKLGLLHRPPAPLASLGGLQLLAPRLELCPCRCPRRSSGPWTLHLALEPGIQEADRQSA